MIRQQVGDLLEIELENEYYYVVVLSNIVMFGGNIVFAFYTDGNRVSSECLINSSDGFLICSDLLYAKKYGQVKRLLKLKNISRFWVSEYAKWHGYSEEDEYWKVYDILEKRGRYPLFTISPTGLAM